MQMTEDEKWMKLALNLAHEAADADEIPVGAVLVRNGEVIVEARNRCEELHDATAHAERLAISMGGAATGSWRLSDCTLYVTMEPCPMCMGSVINARLGRVVYGAKDPRAGACESLIRMGEYPLEATPECVGGVLEDESHALLRAFFEKRRKETAKKRSQLFTNH